MQYELPYLWAAESVDVEKSTTVVAERKKAGIPGHAHVATYRTTVISVSKHQSSGDVVVRNAVV